ncbi:MAG: hypothetical protein IT172_01255 [Acidobacteria bacterium]|nr:hypothetical protein [Acidobacteriota bacterium]
MKMVEVQKHGSVVGNLSLGRTVSVVTERRKVRMGDVVAVRALTESLTYGNIELPSGRLAKVNSGDVFIGAFGKRRALKGFVGEVPESVQQGERLHLLNMGGVIGECRGHHSSFSDAIEVEVIGVVCCDNGGMVNIDRSALPSESSLKIDSRLVVVAGSCMNSGKTVAATEIIKQAAYAGVRVAGAKLTGIACMRDTLNMQDHGAVATASFLDCGLPSSVDHPDLASVAKGILNHLEKSGPELIVAELGDGILGGYSVESILADAEIRDAMGAFVFCASDYVGVAGGISILKQFGIIPDVIAGSVTDSQMGEDFVAHNFGIAAGNARRDGKRLYELVDAAHTFAEAVA